MSLNSFLGDYGMVLLLALIFAGIITQKWMKNKKIKKMMEEKMKAGKVDIVQPVQQQEEEPKEEMPKEPAPAAKAEPEPVIEQAPPVPEPEVKIEPISHESVPHYDQVHVSLDDLHSGRHEKDGLDIFDKMGIEEDESPDIIKKVDEVTKLMGDEDEKIDKSMDDDVNSTKEKLVKLKSSKEEIRRYGEELARIFKKYESREMQLELTIQAMDKLREKLAARQNRVI